MALLRKHHCWLINCRRFFRVWNAYLTVLVAPPCVYLAWVSHSHHMLFSNLNSFNLLFYQDSDSFLLCIWDVFDTQGATARASHTINQIVDRLDDAEMMAHFHALDAEVFWGIFGFGSKVRRFIISVKPITPQLHPFYSTKPGIFFSVLDWVILFNLLDSMICFQT